MATTHSNDGWCLALTDLTCVCVCARVEQHTRVARVCDVAICSLELKEISC